MNIDLVFRNKTEDPAESGSADRHSEKGRAFSGASKIWEKDFFERIIKGAIESCSLQGDNYSLSVNLIEEAESQKLNKEHRGKDKPTNVLSFPLDPKSGDLGDLFICLSIAKNEAKEENMSIERKLAWLTVHGFLHLVGYDHELSKEEELKMQELENKILEEINA